jgi:hypothetical protein
MWRRGAKQFSYTLASGAPGLQQFANQSSTSPGIYLMKGNAVFEILVPRKHLVYKKLGLGDFSESIKSRIGYVRGSVVGSATGSN